MKNQTYMQFKSNLSVNVCVWPREWLRVERSRVYSRFSNQIDRLGDLFHLYYHHNQLMSFTILASFTLKLIVNNTGGGQQIFRTAEPPPRHLWQWKEVGQGGKDKIIQGAVRRPHLFLTSVDFGFEVLSFFQGNRDLIGGWQ